MTKNHTIGKMNTEIATLRAELEDLRCLAGTRREALDDAEGQIERLTKQDQWQLARIRELEGSNKDRWDRIQRLERDRSSLLGQMEGSATAHASDHVELVARREECEKLAIKAETFRAQNAELRDTAQELAAEASDLRRKLKECQDLNEGQNEVIIELRGECARLRHEVASGMEREGRIAAMLDGAPECHCDDLQEALAKLHKAGRATLGKLPVGQLTTEAIRFIEALTRAGDLLEELDPEPAPVPAKRPPVPASDKDW